MASTAPAGLEEPDARVDAGDDGEPERFGNEGEGDDEATVDF